MQLYTKAEPENAQLREYFTWRETAVTEHQKVNLINKLAGEICLKGRFLAYCAVSEKPTVTEDGRASFPKGTKISYFTVTSRDGKQFFPVFTDREELAKWKLPEGREPVTTLVTFDDFAPILKSNSALTGVVINPLGENFPLFRKLVADWTLRKIELVKKVMKAKAEKDKEREKEN